MYYGQPFNVASASANIPGAGSTTVAVLTAAGVGQRYRILGGQICINRAAGANGDIVLNDTVPGSTIVRAFGLTNAGGGGTTAMPFWMPGPGYMTGDNSVVNLVCTSTAGVGTFSCTIYWLIDPVT